jgi:hypothetical protein
MVRSAADHFLLWPGSAAADCVSGPVAIPVNYLSDPPPVATNPFTKTLLVTADYLTKPPPAAAAIHCQSLHWPRPTIATSRQQKYETKRNQKARNELRQKIQRKLPHKIRNKHPAHEGSETKCERVFKGPSFGVMSLDRGGRSSSH